MLHNINCNCEKMLKSVIQIGVNKTLLKMPLQGNLV